MMEKDNMFENTKTSALDNSTPVEQELDVEQQDERTAMRKAPEEKPGRLSAIGLRISAEK